MEYAVAVGLAAGCEITKDCKFDRKNYFYPDNPQNYQISQLYLPVCKNGSVEIETEAGGRKRIGIHEIHMEEDAGKLVHEELGNSSIIDFNRSGVPLIEIVSKPDMRSAKEAIAFLEKLRLLIQYLGASDCKLQEGSMRADVNLSVREAGQTEFGTRTEMKNLNSFKAIARAAEHERNRQIDLILSGQPVVQETRRWDDAKGNSYSMRSKEDAKDYRYFPDPDLPPVHISDAWIADIRKRQPEFREEKVRRFQEEYGLPLYDAKVLTETRELADFFEETAKISGKPKKASNWVMGETMRLLRESGREPGRIGLSPGRLAKMIDLIDDGVVNGAVAKEVFAVMFEEDVDPGEYVREHGLAVIGDADVLRETVMRALEGNPKAVEDYRNGKKKAMGFLVGQTMKELKGKADPGMVNEILRELLSE